MYTKSIVYVLIICVALRRVLDFSVLLAAELYQTRNGGGFMFKGPQQKTFVLYVPSFFDMLVQKC